MANDKDQSLEQSSAREAHTLEGSPERSAGAEGDPLSEDVPVPGGEPHPGGGATRAAADRVGPSGWRSRALRLLGAALGLVVLGGAAFAYTLHAREQKRQAEQAVIEACESRSDRPACSALCSSVPPDLRACVRLGSSLSSGPERERDDARAARLFEAACQGGIPEGCARLGRAQLNGTGTQQSFDRALFNFKMACDAGNPLGCAGYGHMLANGFAGLKCDFDKAAALFKKACDDGEPRGCASLALAHVNGRGVKQDLPRALALFDEVCQRDVDRGCLGKGELLMLGAGTKREPQAALELFKKACEGDSKEGCAKLGAAYLLGEGIARDIAQGIKLLELACNKAAPAGCVELGQIYLMGQGMQPDEKRAGELFKRACDHYLPEGCVAYGKALLTGTLGFKRNEHEGARLVREACDHCAAGPLPCVELALLELTGVGPVKQNVASGLARAEKACEVLPQACTLAGKVHLQGSRGKPEPEKALPFVERACKGGDGGGCAVYGAQLLEGQGVQRDVTRGLALLRDACEKLASGEGCAMYARALLLGAAGPNEQGKGVQIAEALCAQGEAQSCLLAAAGYVEARGVPRDLEKGAKLLVFACQGGFAPACELKQRLPAKLIKKAETDLDDTIRQVQAMAASSAAPSPRALPPQMSFLPDPAQNQPAGGHERR